MANEDLGPIIPDGRNPPAIERAFQQVNMRITRLRNLVEGTPVLNVDGSEVRNSDNVLVRAKPEL